MALQQIDRQQLTLLIIMLAGLTALAPLAIDAYLPAMPAMAAHLQTNIHAVEFSLSVFLAGFAFGQLIGGPSSDRFGRRTIIFIGLTLFLIGSIGVAMSHLIETVWVWRVVQAFGGGLAIVNSAAVIRDISTGRDTARYLSQMAIIMMAAPLLAPLIGLGLMFIAGWQAIFVFLAVYAGVLGVFFYRKLPETRVATTESPSFLARYWQILSHRMALGYLIAFCATYAGLFSFITASPSVYMGYFSVNPTWYPALFAANVITMILCNRLNILLLRKYSPQQLLRMAQIIQSLVGLSLLSYLLVSHEPLLWVIVLGVMGFIGMQAIIVPNALASTLAFFPTNSATASALLGSCGFLLGAGAGMLVTSLSEGHPLVMVSAMSLAAISGWLLKTLIQFGAKNSTGQPLSEAG